MRRSPLGQPALLLGRFSYTCLIMNLRRYHGQGAPAHPLHETLRGKNAEIPTNSVLRHPESARLFGSDESARFVELLDEEPATFFDHGTVFDHREPSSQSARRFSRLCVVLTHVAQYYTRLHDTARNCHIEIADIGTQITAS